QLAYLIYTSGSTGKPKGVKIRHNNLVDYLFGLDQSTKISSCKSFALVSTIATDLGNTVIFSSLIFGGALHVFAIKDVSNADLLYNYFIKNNIDCLKIVPSHWKALSNDNLLLPSKLLVFGGEALQSELVEKIHQSGTPCTIVNHYGPTETTIGKLLHVVEVEKKYNKTIPIGKPFSNTSVYILNKEMNVCPVGIPGQLFISGEGVSIGYLNNENLTNEKFVIDPFDNNGDSRMYATGDLVRYLPDGNIEFIGRVDDQVKIRSYRVELGEIESIIQQSHLVTHAVVIAREDKYGEKRLIAYVVPSATYDKDDIIRNLKEELPEYMLPGFIVELDEMPLTANGKINRKALPDPGLTEDAARQFEAPRNAQEQTLAEIWQDVLEVEEVGIHDDFFELGGHSLLAIRLISAVRKQLKVEMPISDIFDYPTIAGLVTQFDKNSGTNILPAIELLDTRPTRIPLSFSQERLWFIDRMQGSVQYHVPAVLNLVGYINLEALRFSLKSIVKRHEVLRTVFIEEDGEVFQLINNKEHFELTVSNEDIYKHDQNALGEYIHKLINHPFDLSQDDMLRAELIRIDDDHHLLVVTLHHIVSDAWSRSILVKEVVELYNSFTLNREPVLGSIPIQYADYAIWQRNYFQSAVMETKLDYWKNKLSGVPVLDLPTDHTRPKVQSSNGAVYEFNIDKEIFAGLHGLSREYGTTLFMTMLTAFKVLLYKYTNQQDICVGTPVAGRKQNEVENLIGFFVNTIALRNEIIGDATFVNLLQDVRKTTLEAFEFQDLPFEKVVEVASKDRDMSRSPIFQVMFMLMNVPEANQYLLEGLQLTDKTPANKTSKFDLTLSIIESNADLQGSFEYNTDLFGKNTIEQMAIHFSELLSSITKNPLEQVGRLKMLTDREEDQFLKGFNNTASEYPRDKTIVDLFEEQAEKTPDKIAVIFEEEELSYRELNERSNQLANYLRSKGVKA
ncbi:MAG: condensation domain-containing protein, partial [Chitinophagaceae bacterium]